MIRLEDISHTAVHSDEWHKERLGRVTASPFFCLVSDKAEWTQGALTYLYNKAGEIDTGEKADEEFFNDDVDWGNAYEPEAIEWAAKEIGMNIIRDSTTNGTHRFIRKGNYAGCTPDALLNKDVKAIFSTDGEYLKAYTLEVKCPRKHARFIEVLKCNSPSELKKIGSKDSKKYYWQVIYQMFVCNTPKAYFAVYSPKFKAGNIIEFNRNDVIVDIAKAKFITEQAEIEIIKTLEYIKSKKIKF